MAQVRTMPGKVASSTRPPRQVGLRWEVVPTLLVVMLLLTSVSLFHVWSRARIVEWGLQITETQQQLKEGEQENGRLKLEAASLRTPSRIEGIAKGELGMTLPTDQQVVQVR